MSPNIKQICFTIRAKAIKVCMIFTSFEIFVVTSYPSSSRFIIASDSTNESYKAFSQYRFGTIITITKEVGKDI